MDTIMLEFYDDDDAQTNIVERRWFAAAAKAKIMQDECALLREVVDLAEASWRRARTQLAELESMRDALGERLAMPGAGPDRLPPAIHRHGALSAA
jgi:hypothetical protein